MDEWGNLMNRTTCTSIKMIKNTLDLQLQCFKTDRKTKPHFKRKPTGGEEAMEGGGRNMNGAKGVDSGSSLSGTPG